MNDYSIELGIGLNSDDLADIKKKINSFEDNPIKLKVDAETKELTNTIKEALNSLSNGAKNSLTIDTSNLEGSITDIRNAVVDLKKALSSLDDSANFKSLLTSVNQIATALGKVTDESETLVKSLSVLSKKEFGFNFNLKTGNANPIKAATDYGIEARRKAIPALREQATHLQNLLGGYQQADKALERYLVKIHKSSGVSIKSNLIDDMSNTGSIAKQMEAIEKYIDYLKKIATTKGIDLSGFDAQFSKSAEKIVDDTVKIQTGARQTEEALEEVGKEMKQIFGGGVSAEGLSASLEPIVIKLNEIRETIQGLSKGISLDGITSSFNRLSGAIENLLANAEKVKGVLNSGFDVSKINTDVGAIKKNSAQTHNNIAKQVSSNSNSEIDGFLKEFNLTGESAKIVRDKFASLTEAMSHGINSDLYEESLADLINTVRKLGTVSKQSDDDMQNILRTLKGYNIDVSGDYYKQEFGDDWKSARNKNQAILANRNSRTKTPVDVAYEELSEAYPLHFPKDIWNPADQLRKIFEVHDTARYASKNRKVDISEAYSDSNLREWATDIVGSIQEQIKAEQKLAQSSTQTSNTIIQNEKSQQQVLEQKKQRLEEISKLYENYNNRVANLATDSSLDDEAKYIEFGNITNELDGLEQEEKRLKAEIKQIEIALESTEQQAKQTADAVQNISKQTSLVRDGVHFQEVFDSGSQSAKEAQKYFQDLLADEKAVVTVKENFDNSIGDSGALKSFTVDIQRATGEVEKLHYAMSSADDDNRFLYQGASVSDRNIEKQTEARIKSADRLQTQLEEIKTKYKDMGSAKPIKDSDHINALDKQYRKVEKAIDNVRNADNTMSASAISNAEKQKSALENMVREYRNAETLATSLRSKDIKTVGATYSSDLDVLISKMRKDGVYTSGFEKGAENLRSKLSDAVANKDKNGLVGFLNGLDKLEAGYKRASAAKKEFNQSESVGIDTSKLNDRIENLRRISPEIDKFETEINGAKVTVKSLLDDLDNIKVRGDFTVVNKRFNAFEKAAEAAGIAVKETATKARTALANDIKFDIDVGNFENEMDAMRSKFNSLSDANIDLRNSVELVENAYKEMLAAANANTGDEVADRERLIQAEKEYAAALEKTNNLIKKQARADKIDADNRRLADSHKSLELDMVNWLKNNSKAAKEYGDQIDALIISLNKLKQAGNLKQIDVNSARSKFNLLTKDAERRGKTGLTAWDKLVSKVKEYSVYLSAADVFMYASQGLRSMFEQVKLIDSAMTELKKVTNETDAAYNQFLSNAASRAKEIGTTIDGLVSSTADFARLGYDFADAQGLAEVANIYAVVGDDIDGVEQATQSLISTLTAFKDEMGDMDDSEFALSIVDKMNEVANNYAISSGGIGDALQRSASSMMAANNSLDETIALITAAM